jgi:hypothetical protein
MHSHHQATGRESLDLFLANGVVGTRDMGADLEFILPLRDRINRGELLGPEIVASGPILDDAPPDWPFRRRVTSAQEAREAVRDLERRGVDFIKVHDHTPREAYFAIADEAPKLGLPFAGHVPITVTVEEAADSGIKSIEHLANFRVFTECSGQEPYSAVRCQPRFDKLAARGIWQTPTIAFFRALPDAFSGNPLPHAEYASDTLLELTRRNAEVSKLDEQTLSWFRSMSRTSLAAMHDMQSRGSRFLAGCDGLVPGFCLHDELELMTDAGFSPLQALQTATINPAKFLGREKLQGTIEVGKRADLVLLEADPLTDISNLHRIAAVLVRGRLLSRPDIDRITSAHRRALPNRGRHIANRELGTIEKIDDGGNLQLRLDSGRNVAFNIKENPHLDYGYAVTSHSARGQTADRVLIHVDTDQAGQKLVNQRLEYVAISRGRYDAQIYTNDKSQLAEGLSRDASHRSALEPNREFAPAHGIERSTAPSQAQGRTQRLLSGRVGGGIPLRSTGNLELRSGLAVHLGGFSGTPEKTRRVDRHGRTRPRPGQRFHRAALAQSQVRAHLPRRLRQRRRSLPSAGSILPFPEPSASEPSAGLSHAGRSVPAPANQEKVFTMMGGFAPHNGR